MVMKCGLVINGRQLPWNLNDARQCKLCGEECASVVHVLYWKYFHERIRQTVG